MCALDNFFHSRGLILNLETVHDVKFRECLIDRVVLGFQSGLPRGVFFMGIVKLPLCGLLPVA